MDAIGVPCEVSRHEQLAALVRSATAHFGKTDILCCNAGVVPHTGPLHTVTDKDWNLTIDINLRSMLWLTCLVVPEMAARVFNDGNIHASGNETPRQ